MGANKRPNEGRDFLSGTVSFMGRSVIPLGEALRVTETLSSYDQSQMRRPWPDRSPSDHRTAKRAGSGGLLRESMRGLLIQAPENLSW